MTYILRPFQDKAVDSGLDFLLGNSKDNAIEVLPTGSGKSLVIANIAAKLSEPTLILQPSSIILKQNYEKFTSYGYKAGIYSASAKRKDIDHTTFATIGSIINNPEIFKVFKYHLIDECHTVNSKGGQYEAFINTHKKKTLGFTATPYRLSTDGFGGSMLKFLTRTRPRIFSKMVFHVQTKELFDAGYLCPLKYYSIGGFDRSKISVNSTGADFDDRSLQKYYEEINFPASIERVVGSLMKVRKNVLVFTQFVKEAEILAQMIPGLEVVHAKTPPKEMERILTGFKNGTIKAVANVGILTTGFDKEDLETVVVARPTMSLSLWYQMVGRAIRIHIGKTEAWIIDMGDNLRLFGRVEDLEIKDEGNEKWYISSNGRKLTNEYYGR